jgi:hypothetical protein
VQCFKERRDLSHENLALRQQLAVLKRSQTRLKIKQRKRRANANTLLYENPISRQYKWKKNTFARSQDAETYYIFYYSHFSVID